MAHDADEIRRIQAADARLAALNVAASDRPAARRVMVRQIEAEEASAALAETARAEAEAERRRVAAVVKAGRDTSRPRQALRLALAGPVTTQQASAILKGLPLDADAKPEHLALTGAGTFGPPGAVAERRRLVAIFAHDARLPSLLSGYCRLLREQSNQVESEGQARQHEARAALTEAATSRRRAELLPRADAEQARPIPAKMRCRLPRQCLSRVRATSGVSGTTG